MKKTQALPAAVPAKGINKPAMISSVNMVLSSGPLHEPDPYDHHLKKFVTES
jgi:hypothetical protein